MPSYRYTRLHPCARCGQPMTGRRKLCSGCWNAIPADIKSRIIAAAMADREITIDLSDIPTAPRMKRLPPMRYEDTPW